MIDGWGKDETMWPRAHHDVFADSRNLDCPIAEPETIGDALKSATLVLPFILELCAFEAVALGYKTGSCLPRGGTRDRCSVRPAVVWRGRRARGDGDHRRPRTNRAAASRTTDIH